MRLTIAGFAAVAAIALTVPALADPAGGQVVAAAPAGPAAPPTSANPPATPAQLAPHWADEDDGPVRDDRKIHGEISVGVGTNGYREVSGAATAPLPNGGQAAIAIDVGQIGPYRR